MANRPTPSRQSRTKEQPSLSSRRQEHTKSSLEIYKYVLRLPLKELKHSNSKGHSHSKGTARPLREDNQPSASVSAFLERKSSVERNPKGSTVCLPYNNKSTELLCTDRLGQQTDRKFTLKKLCSEQLPPTEPSEQQISRLLRDLKHDRSHQQMKQNLTPSKPKNILNVKLPQLMCLINDFVMEKQKHRQLTRQLNFYQLECQSETDSILKVLGHPK